MADEEIVIEVKYDVDESEKGITELTDKVIALEDANKSLRKDLKKSDEELKKEGKSRNELAKSVEKNNDSLKNNKKERRDLIKVQKLQSNSMDALKEKNKELIKTRNALDTSTRKARKEFKDLNKTIKNNNETLSKAEQQGGNFGRSVGKYTEGIENAIPGLGRITQSVKSFFTLLLTNPLGLIVAALGSLIAFLKGSERGQQRLNVIMKVGESILGNLKDVVIVVGEALFDMFSNPKEAILSFWKLLKDNVVNRFTGLLELIPRLGEAIGLLFKGEFAASGKVAADAVAKVTLGVEDFTDKAVEGFNAAKNAARGFAEEISTDSKAAIDLANRENDLRTKTRENLVAEAKLRAEIAEIRVKVADKENVEAETRLELLDQAIAKENEVLTNAQELAAERLKLKEIENSLSESTIEDLEERARLEKELIDLQTSNADRRRRLESERQTSLREIRATEMEEIQAFQDFVDELDEADLEKFDAQLEREAEALGASIAANEAKTDALIEQGVKEVEAVKQAEEAKKQLIQKAQQGISNILSAASNLRASQLDTQRQKELVAAGDDEAKKDAINKKFAEKRKRIAITEAVIGGAQMVINGLLTQPFIPAGIAAGAAAAVTAGIQIATISNATFAKGGQVPLMANGGSIKSGTFSGAAHSGGGIDLFTGSGQHVANVEGRENFYVVNKDASDVINSLSSINQSTGGVPLSKSSNFMQDGGKANVSQGGMSADMVRQIVQETAASIPPPVVRVESITTGITDVQDVKQVAVVA